MRVSDAQLDVTTTLLLAALVRGLVVTAIHDANAGAAPAEIDPELLDALLWHAARDGISGSLLNPMTRELEPATEVVETMLTHLADALDAEGDSTRIRELLAPTFAEGTGASRQRQAMRIGGRPALNDLLRRSFTAVR